MIKNYLLIALRNIKRYKGYSLLNILGLSIGVASCLFILLYIQFELSYDNYHKDADRIYRVANSRKTDARLELFATAPMGAAQTIKENFPEVIEAARCSEGNICQVKYKDKQFIEEKTGYVDNELFKIFNIPFIHGNPATVLTRPRTVVITESISNKYFGNINPVGEILLLDTTAYEVDGVIKNFPANTHLRKDFLICFQTSLDRMREFGITNPWRGFNCMNYIKLREGSNAKKFEAKIKNLPVKYAGEELRKSGVTSTLFLQPITDIHLYSDLNWEMEPGGSSTYIYVFSAVGILILLLAAMNYMNLMTARSANRANEVGIRKVVGANKSQLISQFVGESLLTTFISVLISIFMVIVLLPFFNTLTNLSFDLRSLIQPDIIFGMITMTLFISIAAGSYPAFLLSSFKPVSILKGASRQGSSGVIMRKLLVVSQFAISIILIIGLILFYQQVNYMKNQYLGFDKEQKLVIEFDRSIINPNTYESIKREFNEHPAVLSSTFSSSVPGRWMYFWHLHPFDDDKNDQMINCFQVDYDFLSEYNLEIIAGRPFIRDRGIDNFDGGWIINESAVKAFGWKNNEEALEHAINRAEEPVIGVVKDFHLKGLQNKIEPLGIFLMVEDFRYLTLKVNKDNASEVVSYIREKHAKLFPGYLFDYFFLDEDFNKQYESEENTTSLLSVFTTLGIIIAVLGLFGLSAFLTEKRTKEIGIRKVLGASILNIIFVLIKEFTVWVILANIIAWPVAYFLMNSWLQDFAYKTEINWWIFILSGFIALLISLFTVGYQAIIAATANPVEALRYE
ncbi:MAG: ABC transporter permease [bacterium]